MMQDAVIFALFQFVENLFSEVNMLNPQEIKSLSKKLNFDEKNTKHCLRILFSDKSNSIDNDVMHSGDILDFLRMIIKAKNKAERKKQFYSNFLPKFTKKEGKSKTVIYFIRDNFFCAILCYLDSIENKKFKKKFESEFWENLDTFYFSMPEEHINYPMLCREKSDIVSVLTYKIIETINSHESEYVFEQDYIVELSKEIAKEIGFQLFVVDAFRDVLVSVEELKSHTKLLKETSRNLQIYRRKARDSHIFIYCLCETLRDIGYKAEDTYEEISKIVYMENTSVRRRYFEQKKQIKGLHYKNLIKTNDLDSRIQQAVKRISRT